LGTKENLLTAEPAVVVPKESDEDSEDSVVDMRQRMKGKAHKKELYSIGSIYEAMKL
jgi:hypothetical protein